MNGKLWMFLILVLVCVSGCQVNPIKKFEEQGWSPYHVLDDQPNLGAIGFKLDNNPRWNWLVRGETCLGALSNKFDGAPGAKLGDIKLRSSRSANIGAGSSFLKALLGDNKFSEVFTNANTSAGSLDFVSIDITGGTHYEYDVGELEDAFASADEDCLQKITDRQERLFIIFDEGVADEVTYSFFKKGGVELNLGAGSSDTPPDAAEPQGESAIDVEKVLEENCGTQLRELLDIRGFTICSVDGNSVTLKNAVFGFRAYDVKKLLKREFVEYSSTLVPTDVGSLTDTDFD